jgi:hypothetical protein
MIAIVMRSLSAGSEAAFFDDFFRVTPLPSAVDSNFGEDFRTRFGAPPPTLLETGDAAFAFVADLGLDLDLLCPDDKLPFFEDLTGDGESLGIPEVEAGAG